MPDTPETILAFDFGIRRIGVAVGQAVTDSASPLGVVPNRASGPDWAAIDALVSEWRPNRLVVGMPLTVEGERTPFATQIDAFVGALARYERPVDTVDERYSSQEATATLTARRAAGTRGRVRKADIDRGAAVLIAERWLKRDRQSE